MRADTLCRLTLAGCQALLAHGVRAVVDIRFPEEVARATHPFRDAEVVGVHYRNVPLNSGRDPALDADLFAAFIVSNGARRMRAALAEAVAAVFCNYVSAGRLALTPMAGPAARLVTPGCP